MDFGSLVIIGVLIAVILLIALSLLRLRHEPSLWRALPAGLAASQEQALQDLTNKIGHLILSNAEKQEALKEAMAIGLDKVRTENSEKLEAIRATVDERLQGTLDKRLGEAFALVTDRLEQMHKGLGEIQNLAIGAGDLKRLPSTEFRRLTADTQ